MSMEPTIVLATIAAATSHVGLIATASTTYNEPYNIAPLRDAGPGERRPRRLERGDHRRCVGEPQFRLSRPVLEHKAPL